MLILSLAAQLVCFLGILFYSVRRTIRPRSPLIGVLSGTLVLYGLIVGLSFLFSVLIPALLMWLGANKDTVLHSFPEETGAAAAVFLGWLPALIFAIIVRRFGPAESPSGNSVRQSAESSDRKVRNV